MIIDDVTFTTIADGQTARTPEEVVGMLKHFYQVAFDTSAATKNLIISENNAVWEGDFFGKHIGEFAGTPATNRDIRVPICVINDIKEDQIEWARVHIEIHALLKQLRVQ